MRYSHLASIASKALLTSVAESIVILGPIRQVGWASASAAVTVASSADGRPRNGPPEAVRIRRATSPSRSPTRHCQIAECSESIGRSRSSGSPPSSISSRSTRWPPVTSVSLLASATRRPLRARPAPPAARPCRWSRRPRSRRHRACQLLEAAGRPALARELARTRIGAPARAPGQAASWATNSAVARPAARPTRANRSGWAEITSSAWRPIEPVEPRTTTPVTG